MLLVSDENKIYYLNHESVDIQYEFSYFYFNGCLYFSEDITEDDFFKTIEDRVYWKNKQILKIQGKYNLTDLITILYFLDKI